MCKVKSLILGNEDPVSGGSDHPDYNTRDKQQGWDVFNQEELKCISDHFRKVRTETLANGVSIHYIEAGTGFLIEERPDGKLMRIHTEATSTCADITKHG